MEKQTFIFGKRNYILMIAGIVLMVIGYLLMAGGGSENPEVFNPEIFSFQRIGLAPILVVGGLLLEVYAIMTRK